MRKEIIVDNKEEKKLIEALRAKNDSKSARIQKLLDLPDLTKKENSPVKIIVNQVMQLPRFKEFDVIDIPRIVTVQENFDLLNTPADHPSRRETDTYYVTEK